jgi:hypothetical protein
MGRVRYGLIMDIKSSIKGAQRECTYPFQKEKNCGQKPSATLIADFLSFFSLF